MASKVQDLQKLRKQKKRKKALRRFIIFLILFTAFFAGYVTRNRWIPLFEDIFGKYQTTIRNDGTLAGGNFPIDLGHAVKSNVHSLNGRLLNVTDTHVRIYSKEGKQDYSNQYSYSNLAVKTAKNRAVAFDSGGDSFTVLSRNKKVYSKKIDGQILTANISDKDYVGVVAKTDKHVSLLTVYDKKGSEVFYWANGQRIIDVAFTDNARECIVTTMYSSGGQTTANVVKLDFTDEGEEVFNCTGLKSLAIQTVEMEDKTVWLVGLDKLYKISADGSLKETVDFPPKTIESMSVSSQALSISFSGNNRRETDVYIYPLKGGLKVVTFDEPVKKVSVFEDRVCVLTDTLLSSYNIEGKLLATADVKSDYTDFSVMAGYAYLTSVSQIDRIDFES